MVLLYLTLLGFDHLKYLETDVFNKIRTNFEQHFFNFFFCPIFSFLCCCADFLQLREQGPLSSGTVRACHCGGFSCCGAQALGLARLQQLQLPGSGGQAP